MPINLHSLKPRPGRKHPPKRLGRGESSGLGKTSGRGHKGQKARTGKGKRHPAFEGGQMPFARRIPKRGFKNIFRSPFAVINLSSLNLFPAGSEVGLQEFKERGLVKGKARIKILADGELTRPLTVKAHAFSEKARAKIEAVGGRAEVV